MFWRVALATALACGAAQAQTPPPAAVEALIYQPDFFAAYAPRTALDMVRRVPGFTLSEGEERRGFAGAEGNVLIDGASPVGKSEDLEDILDRIPASEVVRIELIRSGAGASNAQGVRLNIVRRPSAGEGVWELELSHANDGRVSPVAEVAWSGRRGLADYSVSAVIDDAHSPIRGDDRAYDLAGVLDEREVERIVENEQERRLSGELTTPFGAGALTITAALSSEDNRERQAISAFDGAGAPDGAERVDARELEQIAEIGASFTHDAGPWSTEAAALVTRRRLSDDETAEEFEVGGAFDESSAERRDVESGETILRGRATREQGDRQVSFGGEIAYNTLDQDLSLTEDDGSGPTPVDVPAANIGIEEWRGEVLATIALRPAARWRVEASAAVESSRLTQSGDVAAVTELTFWKPSLQIAREIGDDDQLRFRIYRDVGQLDFEDFAASAELTGSTIYAGNTNLRPETSWRAELSADWRFDGGAFAVTVFHWAIEDALDLIPIGPPGDQFDARGNIGDATLDGVRVTFEAPAPLLSNAQLRGEALWQESDAVDPLTGASRPQSEIIESSIVLGFRQDFGALDLAWGFDYERERVAPEYRLDRISDEAEADDSELWIETTHFDGVKLRVFAANLVNARDVRARATFDPDRTTPADGAESRDRSLGAVFGVSLQGGF